MLYTTAAAINNKIPVTKELEVNDATMAKITR